MRNQDHGHDKYRSPSEIGQSQKPDKGHVTATRATTDEYSEGGAFCPDEEQNFSAAWLIGEFSALRPAAWHNPTGLAPLSLPILEFRSFEQPTVLVLQPVLPGEGRGVHQ